MHPFKGKNIFRMIQVSVTGLQQNIVRTFVSFRDTLGGGTVAGDLRWTGVYGVQADIVARTHCSVELIKTDDIKVCNFLLSNSPNNVIISNKCPNAISC